MCVGKTFFNYICGKIDGLHTIKNLREETDKDWNLVLLPMIEIINNNRIEFEVDKESCIYTTHKQIVKLITHHGKKQPDSFTGIFHTLNGEEVSV